MHTPGDMRRMALLAVLIACGGDEPSDNEQKVTALLDASAAELARAVLDSGVLAKPAVFDGTCPDGGTVSIDATPSGAGFSGTFTATECRIGALLVSGTGHVSGTLDPAYVAITDATLTFTGDGGTYTVAVDSLAVTVTSQGACYSATVVLGGERIVIADRGRCDAGSPDAGIDAPPGGGGTVTVTVIDSQGATVAPEWAARQDGSGGWQRIPVEGGLYSFDVSDAGGRYGFAIACNGRVSVTHHTVDEDRDIRVLCAVTPAETEQRPLVPACSNAGVLAILGYANFVTFGCVGTIQVARGPHDLLGISRTQTGPDRALIRRAVEPAAVTNVLDVPFNDAQASAPAAVVTLRGRTDTAPLFAFFFTATSRLRLAGGNGTISYGAFPATLVGDSGSHRVCSGDPTGMACDLFRGARDIDHSGRQLPATAQPTMTATSATWEPFAAEGVLLTVDNWTMELSSAWLGGAGSYTFPALCGIEGFPANTCLPATPTTWLFTGLLAAPGSGATSNEIATVEYGLHLARDGLSYSTSARFGTF